MGPGAEVGSRPFAQAVRWCPVGQCTLGSGGLGGAGRGSAVTGSLQLMNAWSSEEFICFNFCSFALMEDNMFFKSQRRAMPRNVQTNAQFYSFHMLAK